MNKKHLLPCLIGVAAGALVLVAVGVNPSTLLLFAVVLACPLMMFTMMKSMMGSTDRDAAAGTGEAGAPSKPPVTNGRRL